MSFTPLFQAHAGGSAAGTTPARDTTGAKLLVLYVAASGAVVISDSAGNPSGNWLLAGNRNQLSIYYLNNPTTSATHTFTVTGSVVGFVVEGYSLGAGNVAALDTPSAQAANTGAFAVTGSAAVLPTVANALVVSAHYLPNPGYGGTWAAAAGFTAVDVQNYVSSTNFGCGAVRQIQTTATNIPASTQTATWTGSISTENFTVVFKEVASGGSLTLTSPSAYEVHQRSGATGSIQITGTVSGSTEDIEASFNGGAYQTIATAVAAGGFSGTLTGQAQGQGTLTVRKKVTTTASATVANVGIGDVFLLIGDSRVEGRAGSAQSYTHATLKACVFRQDNAWANGNDPIDIGTSSGSHWPLLATQIMASQGVPVGFISCGTGGTDVAGVNNSWAKNNADYAGAITQVTNSTVASVKAVLCMLGPNAIVNGNNAAVSLATYRTALDTLAANLAADLPGAPKLFLDVCGEVGTGSPPDRRTAEDNIRGAVLSAWNNNATAIKPGPVLIEQDYADNVHPATSGELGVVAARYWCGIADALYSGSNGRGPRISSATWNVARNQITVIFDRVLKTGLTHSTQPWTVKDNGAAMTVSSVAYHGTNTSALVVTLSAAATGPAATTTLSFASGDDAVGRVVPLSADITLPAGGTTNLPAEPVYAYTVTENSNLATTVTVTLTTDGSTPAANLTGLRWAFFDQALPSSFVAPTAKGSGATTNASGVLTVTITGTGLSVGATGWLEVTNSDGTVSQAGGHKGFAGPVTVS